MDSSELDKKHIALEHNVRKLFIVCTNIKNKVSSIKFINSNNVVYASFDKFVKIYDEIGAEESMVIFEELYKKKRIQILCKMDNWIKDKAILEYPSTKKVKTKGMILLSIFYKNASDISKEAEKEVLEFGRESEASNVYLPEELIYPLLEIFLLVCPQEDIEILQSYKNEIVAELPSTDITPTMPPIMNNLGGLLGGLLGNLDLNSIQKGMSEIMAASGAAEGGAGGDAKVDPADAMEAVGRLFNNPKSKEIISNVTSKLTNAKGIEDLQSTLGGLLTDKKLIEDVKEITGSLNAKPEPIADREVHDMIEEASKVMNEEVNE